MAGWGRFTVGSVRAACSGLLCILIATLLLLPGRRLRAESGPPLEVDLREILATGTDVARFGRVQELDKTQCLAPDGRVGTTAYTESGTQGLLCADTAGVHLVTQAGEASPDGWPFDGVVQCGFVKNSDLLFVAGQRVPDGIADIRSGPAVYRARATGIERVVGPGDRATDGSVVQALASDALGRWFAANAGGHVLVLASTATQAGLFLQRNDALERIVTRLDPVGAGGEVLTSIGGFALTAEDDVVFAAGLGAPDTPAAEEDAVVLWSQGQLRVLAQPGGSVGGVRLGGDQIAFTTPATGYAERVYLLPPGAAAPTTVLAAGDATFFGQLSAISIADFTSTGSLLFNAFASFKPDVESVDFLAHHVAAAAGHRRRGMNSPAESLKSPLKGTPTTAFAVGPSTGLRTGFSRLGSTEPGDSFPGDRGGMLATGLSTLGDGPFPFLLADGVIRPLTFSGEAQLTALGLNDQGSALFMGTQAAARLLLAGPGPRSPDCPIPPTAAARDTPTPTATPAATPTPARTPVVVRVGSATGVPGSIVLLRVTVGTGGADVAEVRTDIGFDRETAVAAAADGQPDCSASAEVNEEAATFRFLPNGCTPGTCGGMSAAVFGRDAAPIAAGALLYTCRVQIAADAAPRSYPVGLSRIEAADSSAAALPATGSGGEIVVADPGSDTGAPSTGTVAGGGCQVAQASDNRAAWLLALALPAYVRRRQGRCPWLRKGRPYRADRKQFCQGGR